MAQTTAPLAIPEFSCICELCDCGSHKYHKNCTKGIAQVQRLLASQRCLLSHYKSTFTSHLNVHPRSSKRPLHTPPLPSHPRMTFNTTQRSEFIPKELGERTKPYVPKEFYEAPQEPLLSETMYSLHFPPKEPVVTTAQRPSSNIHASQAKFEDHTTNKDFFKDWKSRPQPRYGELPLPPGSLLSPDLTTNMKTTTQEHFIKKSIHKPKLIKRIQSNITIEGDHTMTTTHQNTYQPPPFQSQALPKTHLPERVATKRPHMETVTKYQRDFPVYRSLTTRVHPVYPPLDNLAVNSSFSNDFKTVQRETYHGWDVSKHQRPALIRLKEELTAMEREKGETSDGNTVTKLSYPPLTQHRQPMEPIKRPTTVLKSLKAKFNDTTANKFFFQDWGTQPRIRYGDLYDGLCLRPLARLDNETTTQSTFLPKKAERIQNCKPQHDSIELIGDQDFSTVHRETYRPIPLPVCRLQTYLRQQQKEKEANKNLISPVPLKA
ncbi:stabilizer of axonemal microtubules 1-like [Microcaecilia unicolor]|uniref:Stabilizer of axonemal microtubules 1-like n=1 Tax=Microcaecilia unicolor TaxID=1415580 RepID=A0A6P7ZJ32_9AMPH|nr:stabilizer of axonemal microtubules 1-like [Microcaecilia unicolor]